MRPELRDLPAVPAPPPPPRTASQDGTSGEDSEKASRASTVCKFFGRTYKGCARGNRCPFKHSWEGIEKEKSSRCLACGGKGHTTKDCHTKKNPTTLPSTKAPPPKPGATTPTTSSTTTNKTVRTDEVPQVEQIPSRSGQASSSNQEQTLDLKEMLADVGKMLKSMQATSLKRATVLEAGFEDKLREVEVKLRAVSASEPSSLNGLLDSGASHPMRSATTE